MKPDYFIISRLIAASITNELTEEEQAQLDGWREESEQNGRLFDELTDAAQQKATRTKFDAYDTAREWAEFTIKKQKAEKKRLYARVSRYAAAIVLPVLAAAYFLLSGNPDSPAGETGNNVLLRMAEVVIDLTATSGEIAAGEAQAIIINEHNMLSYEDTPDTEAAEPISSELFVPKGTEYQIKLADGTLVFLNAETKLRFPSRFTGDTREVYLEGEAYFDVARDEQKPFIVKTAQYDVRVLGTRFNISAYPEGNYTRTVLVEGSVAVSGGAMDKEVILKPNQLLDLDTKGAWSVTDVDAQYYTAWKDGRFRFLDERLEDIMLQIARWYDVEVVFADEEVKDYRFGFFANRNETIEPVIRIFEQNGKITIERDEKTIRIKRSR